MRLTVTHPPLLLLTLLLLCGFDPFTASNENVEEGNAKLGAGKVKEALEYYDKAARDLPDEAGVQYNRGVALFRLGQLEKAKEALLRGTTAQDRNLRAKSFYNLGNTHFELKQYKEAVEAYKRSLQLDPGHGPSKWNLELALRRLKEEEKKKKKEQKKKGQQKKDQKKNKDQNQQQSQKQERKDKGQQDQDSKPRPKQDKERKKQNQPEQKEKEQQRGQDPQKSRPRPDQREMSSVLDALDRGDKRMQRRWLRARSGGFQRPAKDW